MPRQAIMNGMTSHAFAAVMVGTVMVFPTPSDLWATVTKQRLHAPISSTVFNGTRQTVPVVTDGSSLIEVKEALKHCIFTFSKHVNADAGLCLETITIAKERVLFDNPSLQRDQVEAALMLAEAYRCRSLWVENSHKETSVLPAECETKTAALAELQHL